MLSLDLGKIWIFWRYFYCRWPEDQKIGSALMPIEGLFLLLASIQAQIIVKGITQKWNSNNKDCKKETIETLMWLRRSCTVELSFVKQNVLQRGVSKLLNESPHDQQNQRNWRYTFRTTIAMKSWYNFWLTLAIIRRVEIEFLFISFKRLRLEREQIRQILLDLKQLTSDTSFTLEKLFSNRAERDFWVARRPCKRQNRDESSCRETNFKYDEKLLWKSKTLLENVHNKSPSAVRPGPANLVE